jgi:quinol monooxygenase YgiN
MFIVIIYCAVKPDCRADFLAAAAVVRAATRQEPGNLAYGCFEDPQTLGCMTFIEEWQSREAIQAHMAAPHTQAFLGRAMAMLADPPSMRMFEVAGIEPLSLEGHGATDQREGARKMETERKVAANPSAKRAEIQRLDALLDDALMDTFPASDPVAVGLGQHRTKKDATDEPPAPR